MIKRIAEARSIITHGLGENATDHEKYIGEFREMVAQIERIYPNWLRDKGIIPKPVTETKECEDDKTQTEAPSS